MKKIIFTFTLALLLSLALSIGALASSEGIEATAAEEVTAIAQTEEAGIFDAIFDVACKYSGEILSALAFFSSALVALAYKKGLFPTLKSGIGKLSEVVGGIKENVEQDSKISKETLENVNNYVQNVTSSIERFEKSILDFEKRMEKVESNKQKDEVFSLLMNEQIELLSDVFLSSSLPQYRKELIGERTVRMKERLRALTEGQGEGSAEGE